MSIKPKIVCVIPAYNEAKNIGDVLPPVFNYVDEVIVVDDGSSDNTAEIASLAGAIVLRHVTNRGQGAALRTGTKYAIDIGADIIVHFDADGQFLAEDISELVNELTSNNNKAVFGSRFLNKKSELPWFKEKVIMPIARFVNYVFWGIRLTDPQSGFRAFKSDIFESIIWEQDGMAHCSEILNLIHRTGENIKEVPIRVIYNRYGQNFSSGVRIIKDIFISRLLN